MKKSIKSFTIDRIFVDSSGYFSLLVRSDEHHAEANSVFRSQVCTVEWMDPTRFAEVREFARRRQDEAWSFTDCFSFWVMEELKLRRAMTNDHHFRQAGFEPLLF